MLWERNYVVGETKFDDLDDDCCREILRQLPLDDLCALSRTCTRLYNLCSEQFSLQYKSKVVYIETGQNSELVMMPSNEEYVKCFAKSVQNIVLRDNVVKSKLNAVQAYYSQSESTEGAQKAVNIKQISFEDCTLTKEGGTTIADMLKTVETIRLHNFETADDLHDCVLKHTPNLKCLKLQWVECSDVDFQGTCSVVDQGWLKKTYPSLETLEWHTYDPRLEPKVSVIKNFLRLNPNITKFSLFTNSIETINNFAANDVQIDELYFCTLGDPELEEPNVEFSKRIIAFENLCSKRIIAFENLCDKQNTKLHLFFMDTETTGHLDEFWMKSAIRSKIEGLYFHYVVRNNNRIDDFENLRCLMLGGDDCNVVPTFLDCPNLEELYITYSICDRCLIETIFGFVGYSAKLTKLYFVNHKTPFTKFDFEEFNNKRMKLKNAAKLKIYIESSENGHTGNLNDFKRIYESFEIIRAGTEMQDDVFFTFRRILNKMFWQRHNQLFSYSQWL